MKLLITDLDNTLYDWVTFFAHSFDAMVQELSTLLDTDRHSLLSEFKEIHQRYGSTETPWAALELPTVRVKFPGLSNVELATRLEPAFRAFSDARRQHLRLYPSVNETLSSLRASGVMIIGHTEALPVNAFYRLWRLGITDKFRRLYTIEGHTIEPPFPDRPHAIPSQDLIRTLPSSERKPNPAVLLDICAREGFKVHDCCYLGDSLIRDIAMAKDAGMTAVWARYGTRYEPRLWDLLVAVTHWTAADVQREAKLREAYRNIAPDKTIDTFSDILGLVPMAVAQRTARYE